MPIDDQPKPSPSREELRTIFQLNTEGVSKDYRNYTMMASMYCKALLHEPNFSISHYGVSEAVLKIKVLKNIKELPSYTEYMARKGKTNGIGMEDFLTERGKEIVIRLDQITSELKTLYVEDPQALDVVRALALLKEIGNLIT